MKRGFTLVELLAITVIITILLLIAVPIYNGISNSIKESIYESKIKEVLAKSISYASEQNKFVFDIKTLIQNGSITADNELGEFIDPRSNRDMQCDIINVVYKDNQYNASITESSECFEEEELEKLYGIVELTIEDENKNEIPKIEGTEWLNKSEVYVSYKIKENYQEYQDSITSITWLGEAEKSCNKDNLEECERYLVTSEEIKNVVVSLQIKFNINNAEIINTVNKTILLDLQKPTVVDGSIVVNNDINTNNARKVDFEITDQSGSGVKYYSIVKEKTCNGTEFESNKQLAENGIQSVYLENGSYYICVEDKVGNKTSDSDLDSNQNKITVSGVDQSIPVINSFAVKSRVSSYNSLDTTLTISASDDNGTSGLKMCISNTGYLSGCSWENYSSTKNWRLSGTLDGGTRTVYLSIQDSAGNIVNREAKYTVYKDCSNQSKVYIESTYGACSKTCGGGVQYRAYQMKDTKTNTICSTGKDSKTCNTNSCTMYRFRKKQSAEEIVTYDEEPSYTPYLYVCSCSCAGFPKGGTFYKGSPDGSIREDIMYTKKPTSCSPKNCNYAWGSTKNFVVCSSKTKLPYCNEGELEYTYSDPHCTKRSKICPSGMTLNGNICYGPWSNWSEVPISETDDIEVEIKQF